MATKIKRRPYKTWAGMPPVLDSEDVALLFGLTVQHVRTLARQGKIPATKVGKNYRYEKGQLMKFMNAVEEAQP